jgi:sugar/nucleoside kinase (ribokinase family)
MAAALTKYYGAVVLKLGGAGCVLAVPDADPVHFVAHPADVRDTTGAGDAFCAAFLSKCLSVATPSVATLQAAAEFAIDVAATAVTHLGGRPPTPPH